MNVKKSPYSADPKVRAAEKKLTYFVLGSMKGAKNLFEETYQENVEPYKKAILEECDKHKINIADASMKLFETQKSNLQKVLHMAALGEILMEGYKE